MGQMKEAFEISSCVRDPLRDIRDIQSSIL